MTPSAPSALWGLLLAGGSAFAVDPPIVQDANFRANATYFSYLDSQARAAQTHLVQSLLGGLTATWRQIDGGSGAVAAGDAMCLAGSTAGTVTRATTTPLAAAGSVFGIALQGGAPGGWIPIAVTGLVSPAITGLPTSGALTYATVNTTTARLQTSAAIGGSAYVVGTVDAAGNVNVRAMPQLATGIGIAGDVTGTLGASVVSAISGSSPLPITTATLRWVAGTTSPTISQAIAAAGPGQTLSILAQSAAVGSASYGGDVQIAGGAPDGAAQQGGVVISSHNAIATLQLHNATSDYLAMGVVPASSGYVRLPNTASIAWRDAGNTKDFLVYVDSSGNLNLGDNSALLNSIHVGCTPVQWHQAITSPTLTQIQQANGSNPNNLTIAPQAPGAGAASTATGTPGNLVVSLAAPVSTGTYPYLNIVQSSVSILSLGTWPSGSTYQGLFSGVPSSASFLVMSNGTSTYVNAPSGSLLLGSGGTGGTFFTITATGNIQLLGSTVAFGGGTGVIGVTNATTNPSTNPTGGIVLYGTAAAGVFAAGGFAMRGSGGSITELASPGNGSVNTQSQSFLDRTAYLRTAASTATTIYTTPSFASTHVVTIVAYVNSADQVTPGNACGAVVSATYYNNAGTMTQVGSTTTIANHNYTTPPAFTVTGATINLQVSAKAANNTDHQARIFISYN